MPRHARLGPMRPRVVATFALIPAAVGFELGVILLADELDRMMRGVWMWALAAAFPGLAFFFGVGLIWWRTVAWTSARRIGVLVTTAAYLIPLMLAVLWQAYTNTRTETFVIALAAMSLVGCAAAMAVVGRITWNSHESEASVPCPQCGYDLRGQRECRCPECGEQFTVGELVSRDSRIFP